MIAQIQRQNVELKPTGEQVGLAVRTLKLLADDTRLRLMWALLHGEHSVGELAEHVDAQPPNVSQHLAKLRLARLVRTRRVGNHVLYLAEDSHVRRLVEEALFHADHVDRGLPDHQDPAAPAGRESSS